MLMIRDLAFQNPFIMAPIAGYTDSPFRRMVKSYGASLVYTELLSADAIVHSNKKTLALMSHLKEEKPLTVQLLGKEPGILVHAARIAIASGADIIDLNMGCPASNVVNNGSGAALMKAPELVREIIKEMRAGITVPFTIKTRIGWDDKSKNVLQILEIANEEGIDAIAIHLRTKMQGFKRGIDMQTLTDAVKISRIPVIGNGDILTPYDAKFMLEQSGCAGIMIGRGALGAPWIFGLLNEYMENNSFTLPELTLVKNNIIRHLNFMIGYYGEEQGVKLFRKHLVHYSKGSEISPLLRAPNSSDFRSHAVLISDAGSLFKLIDQYFYYLEKHFYGVVNV